jgi:hypothetical protein
VVRCSRALVFFRQSLHGLLPAGVNRSTDSGSGPVEDAREWNSLRFS